MYEPTREVVMRQCDDEEWMQELMVFAEALIRTIERREEFLRSLRNETKT